MSIDAQIAIVIMPFHSLRVAHGVNSFYVVAPLISPALAGDRRGPGVVSLILQVVLAERQICQYQDAKIRHLENQLSDA